MVSVAAKLTNAPHAFAGASTVIVAGTTIDGAIPLTVIFIVEVAILPTSSIAVNVTVVVPIGNTEPLAGTAVTVTLLEQLSIAVGIR